ncbi:MAG: lamin tail domain-containing protein [Candidatus Cloacimonetes bacterium]|nr:lamin tail domain-containing protein [Candidatus Cloacimonadota bacterium]
MQLPAAIVINEVYYDHPSSDAGYEWIELYNNGSENVQLQGAKILAAGTVWGLKYELPAFVLRPGRFLLIGESNVPNAQLTATLGFENGDTATDGVRYLSPDGFYTDTVLYCSPNSHALKDDTGSIGISFAPDVPAGASLARAYDGVDSNESALDFKEESSPTPGQVNRVRCDYALLHSSVTYEDGYAQISVWIKNLSDISPAYFADFSIKQEDVTLYDADISPIPPLDSLQVQAGFFCSDLPIMVNLDLLDDPVLTNNSLTLTPNGATIPSLYISEFLANPDSGNQEWIEIYSKDAVQVNDTFPVLFHIRDSSGGSFNFTLPSAAGYYVICRDAANLRIRYPDCPSAAIVTVASWVYLNNDGDFMVLSTGGTVLDSLAYIEDEIMRGVSRERYLDNEGNSQWYSSFSSSGGTPGQPNSIPPQIQLPEPGSIKLSGSPCKTKQGESISIAYNLQAVSNRVSCNVFDLRGVKVRSIADNTLITESGVFYWNGRKQDGSFAPRGLYFILWESQASSGGKVLRKQLSAVISN